MYVRTYIRMNEEARELDTSPVKSRTSVTHSVCYNTVLPKQLSMYETHLSTYPVLVAGMVYQST